MDILQLQYFCVVAKSQHMTNAARELHIAQPALSMMISKLEKELGVPLFDRQGRGIKLNTYGDIVFRKSEKALSMLDEMKREVQDMSGEESGLVSLMVSSLSRYNDLISDFLFQYPDVNFRITQELTIEKREQVLERNEIDFCFSSPPIEKPGIRGINLLTENFLLGVANDHRLASRQGISLNEVKDESFISYKQGTSPRTMHENFCHEAGFQPNIVCEMEESLLMISSLVSSGVGVSFFPAQAKTQEKKLADLGNPITLLKIDEPACQRTLQLSWNEKRYLSKVANNFKDFVIDNFSDFN